MEKKLEIEKRTLTYFGEEYEIEVIFYTDPVDGYKYTTTESDQKWWEDLRTQYIERHPEALERFSTKPELTETEEGWMARYNFVSRSGRTKEEAIKNLFICLSIE